MLQREHKLGFDVDAYYGDEGSEVSTKAAIEAAFAEAADWAQRHGGGCDGFLSLGSLDCVQSQELLSRAIGRTIAPSIGIWPADEVRQLAAAAVWPDPNSIPADERWAYWSARKFLEVCVQHGLGIWTS